MVAIKDKHSKCTDYSKDEIKGYLEKFRKCISEGRYTISQNSNRQENNDFIEDYRIDEKKEREILVGLQFDDFCYSLKNDNRDFPDETLFVFCKQHRLDNWGTRETVDIYIKLNCTGTKSGDQMFVVVSFHKRNFEISYLFR